MFVDLKIPIWFVCDEKDFDCNYSKIQTWNRLWGLFVKNAKYFMLHREWNVNALGAAYLTAWFLFHKVMEITSKFFRTQTKPKNKTGTRKVAAPSNQNAEN